MRYFVIYKNVIKAGLISLYDRPLQTHVETKPRISTIEKDQLLLWFYLFDEIEEPIPWKDIIYNAVGDYGLLMNVFAHHLPDPFLGASELPIDIPTLCELATEN
jgi:hypothetical protein